MNDLLFQNKSSVGGILETDLKGEKFKQVLTQLSHTWSVLSNTDLHTNCRIIVVWNDDLVNFHMVSVSAQHFHYVVSTRGLAKSLDIYL